MDQDQLESLFEFKSDLSKVGTEGESGTGFGIPIIKKTQDQYGADMKVESNFAPVKGHGSKFIM